MGRKFETWPWINAALAKVLIDRHGVRPKTDAFRASLARGHSKSSYDCVKRAYYKLLAGHYPEAEWKFDDRVIQHALHRLPRKK